MSDPVLARKVAADARRLVSLEREFDKLVSALAKIADTCDWPETFEASLVEIHASIVSYRKFKVEMYERFK